MVEKVITQRKLNEYVGQIHIPTIKVAEMKRGKKQIVEKKFMPGYIIAQLDLLNEDIIFLIQSLPSISGFVMSPKGPQTLSEEEVRNLMQTEESETNDGEAVASTPRVFFQVGERVKIIDGPFANFSGVVDEIIPDKVRLRVKVEIFGQATPVELEYLQVASNVG